MLVEIAAGLFILLVIIGFINATIGWEIALCIAALGGAVLWFGPTGFIAIVAMVALAMVGVGYVSKFENEWFGLKPIVMLFGGIIGLLGVLKFLHL